jgi:hypothetical protein
MQMEDNLKCFWLCGVTKKPYLYSSYLWGQATEHMPIVEKKYSLSQCLRFPQFFSGPLDFYYPWNFLYSFILGKCICSCESDLLILSSELFKELRRKLKEWILSYCGLSSLPWVKNNQLIIRWASKLS